MYTSKGQAPQPPYPIVGVDPCADPHLVCQTWAMSQPSKKSNLLMQKSIVCPSVFIHGQCHFLLINDKIIKTFIIESGNDHVTLIEA
jgi:hypothetical protein